MKVPFITDVAIIYEGQLHSLPKPWRHHHVLQLIGNLGGPDTQGFLTEDKCFLGRLSARKFAIASGQIENKNSEKALYSEDIWPNNYIEQYTQLSQSKDSDGKDFLSKSLVVPAKYIDAIQDIIDRPCHNDYESAIKQEVLFSFLNYLFYLNKVWPQEALQILSISQPDESYALIR